MRREPTFHLSGIANSMTHVSRDQVNTVLPRSVVAVASATRLFQINNMRDVPGWPASIIGVRCHVG